MERRSFLLGLLALSTGSAAAAIAGKAEGAAVAPAADALARNDALTLPDGTPVEYAQHRRRRRRTVCSWRRDRWGRRVRVCRSVWY